MTTVLITQTNLNDMRLLNEVTDVVVDSGLTQVDMSILARRLLTPPGCLVRSNTMRIAWAEVHADMEVFGPAYVGGGVFMGNLRCHHGLVLGGDILIYGDLVITGGEMVTDHDVVVKGKARFEHRPSGCGALYCDDPEPCGPDGD